MVQMVHRCSLHTFLGPLKQMKSNSIDFYLSRHVFADVIKLLTLKHKNVYQQRKECLVLIAYIYSKSV